jgi:hypothetical protein
MRQHKIIMVATATLSITFGAVAVSAATPKPAQHPTTTIKKAPAKPVPYPADAAHGITPAVMAQWQKVAICEEGGNWHVRGSVYSGGLGIMNTNWTYYSRGLNYPASAADATPAQQVVVARRIQGNNYVPDQYGCSGSW